jgi:hypothetical protein
VDSGDNSLKTELILEGFATPEQAGSYLSLPFEMPPGVGRLEVHYEYSAAIGADPHLTGGNTVDIGLFDERGDAFLDAGFRGWTGSARREFFITPAEATPGYVAGPLTPGMWAVSLGFYKVAPQGCHYRVTIRFFPGVASEPSHRFPELLNLNSPNCDLPPRPGGWYRGELHCHTYHSDGDSSPAEVIAAAEALGLDFLAITDHNSIGHLADLAALGPQKVVLIPGCEVTTYKGHWNIWGLDAWNDFRVLTPEHMSQSIQQAVRRGYLTSCNHPRTYGPPWEFEDVGGYHCVEVWNGPWQLFNYEALSFWEKRLRRGERLVAVGGSDAHFLKQEHIARIGTPTTWIHCPGDPTAAGLLAGLRAGHVFISDAPNGPQVYLSTNNAMMGDTLARPVDGELTVQVRVVKGKGLVLELHDAANRLQSLPVRTADEAFTLQLTSVATTPYIRAQLVEPDTVPPTIRALTNPLYLR